MRADQRDRILKAADKVALDMNGLGLQESLTEAHRIFSRLAEISGQIKTREQVLSLFDSFPDLSWQDEKVCLAVSKYSKHLFRLGVLAMAAEVKDSNPKPPGGRKRLFQPHEEMEVCEFVADLIVKKVELQFAYQRAGAHFGVSARSIRRLWENRDDIAAELRDPDFDTTLAAVKGFLLEEQKIEAPSGKPHIEASPDFLKK